MFRENIIKLKQMSIWPQEEVTFECGISRQAYAKWESGESVSDKGKCALLASLYGVSLDSLVSDNSIDGITEVPPAPKGKDIWGSVTRSERG